MKRLSSNIRKTPPSQRANSIEQQSPPTLSIRKTTQEILRKKPSFEHPNDRSTSSSRRISMGVNDDPNPLSKIATPQPYDRTPTMLSRSLTRSNSMNPANKDQEKVSSGERSYHNSAAQSRRVSIGVNRSPIRAEELQSALTKVNHHHLIVVLCSRIFSSFCDLYLIFFSLSMKKSKLWKISVEHR